MRGLWAVIAALFLMVQGISAAPKLGENPFTKKFGGPYKENVGPQFRKDLVELGGGLRGAFGSLGADGMKDKAGFESFCKEFIDPQIAKLNAKTEAEKKLKESATQVKKIMSFALGIGDYTEEQRKEYQAFLDGCALPGEAATDVSKLGGMLIRFTEYSLGMSPEEFQKAMEKAEKEE
jgi:hypothetical protein